MRLELVRFAYTPWYTLGRLGRAGDVELATIERPWIRGEFPGGRPAQSCVPDGVYTIRPHDSEKFPGTYALDAPASGVFYSTASTWGRSAILIHKGNRVDDVIGCIAIGLEFGTIGSARAVLQSGQALEQLRVLLGRQDTHELLIRPSTGTSEV